MTYFRDTLSNDFEAVQNSWLGWFRDAVRFSQVKRPMSQKQLETMLRRQSEREEARRRVDRLLM